MPTKIKHQPFPDAHMPLGTDEYHCQRCGGELRDGTCPLCPSEREQLLDFADNQARWNLIVFVWLVVLSIGSMLFAGILACGG